MSETKFTPGPWFASQWFPDEKADQWAIGLSASSGCRGGEYLSMSGICREADAHLIAAAPDLYEALVLLSECEGPETRSFYDEDGVEGWEWTHPDGRTWQVLCGWEETPIHPVAEAALAKARGES